jgi:hypothetical protein
MNKKEFKIAVLLPTHKRTDALSRCVMSLIDLANDLDSIQFIFGIDDNDSIGMTHFTEVLQPVLDDRDINYTAMEFEHMGYGSLNRYYNALSEQADADWYFVWCDDAIMQTQDWDSRITECTGEFKLLKVHTHNEHPYSIFPIIPAEWKDITGTLSRHQLIDAEVSQIAYMLNIVKIIDVNVVHDRHDLTGNNKDENVATAGKIMFEGNPNNPYDFHNPVVVGQRNQDIDTISAWMEAQGKDTTWWNNVKLGKQDPWEQMRENDINKQTSLFSIKHDVLTGQKTMVKQDL